MNIFLHRDDLRIFGNVGLTKAVEDGETIPVYIRDPRTTERLGKNKKAFREAALDVIRDKYRQRDSGLIATEGETAAKLKELASKFDVEKIFYNRGYSPLQRKIQEEIEELDTKTESFKDRLLVEPQELNREYDTFSPFYTEWKKKQKPRVACVGENLAKVSQTSLDQSTISSADMPDSGEDAALRRWREFRDNRLKRYKNRRDDVHSPKSVSRLSMYYSSGMIDIRKVYKDIEELIDASEDSSNIRNYAKYT